jgi:acyl carrier protein
MPVDGPNDPDTESVALTEWEISGLIESFFDRPVEAIWRAEDHLAHEHRTGLSVEEVRASLAEIIEEVTGIDPSEVTIEKVLIDDLLIDSLSAVEIAARIEDKHCIRVYDEGLIGLRTVGDAITYIQRVQPKL